MAELIETELNITNLLTIFKIGIGFGIGVSFICMIFNYFLGTVIKWFSNRF